MARFLLSPMPFTGHVTPMTAVARALVARGHDVRVYTGSRFAARIEGAGARLVSWAEAPDFDENDLAATFPRLVGKKGMQQLLINVADCFIGTAPAQVHDLEAEWQRDPWDVLVGDEVSIGMVLFSMRRRTPWATVAVVPLNLPGPAGPPSGLGIMPGTNPLTKTRDAALRGLVPVLARALRGPMDTAFRSVGLPTTRLTMDKLVFSPQLIAASGSPSLDFGRTDRPAHLHFVGQLAASSTSVPLPAWWRDLDGRRVVLVTQGTQNIDPDDLLRPALTALAREDAVVVATTGVPGRDALPFDVPANARVTGFAPFAELLPRVAVVIANGGWGGTLATLSHGIPMVIAGGDLDKPEVAARVAWSGAGVNLKTGTPSATKVGDAFRRVTANPSFRASASRVAAELGALGGAERTAELLEEFAVW